MSTFCDVTEGTEPPQSRMEKGAQTRKNTEALRSLKEAPLVLSQEKTGFFRSLSVHVGAAADFSFNPPGVPPTLAALQSELLMVAPAQTWRGGRRPRSCSALTAAVTADLHRVDNKVQRLSEDERLKLSAKQVRHLGNLEGAKSAVHPGLVSNFRGSSGSLWLTKEKSHFHILLHERNFQTRSTE